MPSDVEKATAKLDEKVKELQDGEPEYWHTTDAKTDEGEFRDLPEKPTVEQLRSAIQGVRYDLANALEEIANALGTVEQHSGEIAKLKNHRHEASKNYTSRPEL